jgi:hypothetical protein
MDILVDQALAGARTGIVRAATVAGIAGSGATRL